VPIDAVLFDLDDTLLDHSSAQKDAAIALARIAGFADDEARFLNRWRTHSAEVYPRFLSGEITHNEMIHIRMRGSVNENLSTDAAEELFARYMAEYQAQWRLFPDVLPCLEALSRFKLGIITNGKSSEQRAKIRALNLEERFGQVIVSSEVGIAKPEAAIFLKACADLELAPERALYVGDNKVVDYQAAQAAGLSSVWLNRKAGSAKNAQEIASLAELLGYIRESIR
jgi:putative hydrolase of the HAD superfamily